MDSIKIKDKIFVPYIHSEKISKCISKLAKKINSTLINDNPLFLVILNGSFMFASDLLKEITIPCEISFVKLQSYSGLNNNQKITELIGLTEEIDKRVVVIVEDIVDTGNTVEFISKLLHKKGAKTVKIASLLFKPKAYLKTTPIDFVGFEIPNYFVVGFGMDYSGYGRNLNSIFKLKE